MNKVVSVYQRINQDFLKNYSWDLKSSGTAKAFTPLYSFQSTQNEIHRLLILLCKVARNIKTGSIIISNKIIIPKPY